MDTAAWLADQIEAHTPDKESHPQAAHRIAEAYAALAGAKAPAFGLQELPDDIPDREALRVRALEVMKLWIARSGPEEKEKLKAQLAGYGIGSQPIPVVTDTEA
jgi:hypothetical protein